MNVTLKALRPTVFTTILASFCKLSTNDVTQAPCTLEPGPGLLSAYSILLSGADLNQKFHVVIATNTHHLSGILSD